MNSKTGVVTSSPPNYWSCVTHDIVGHAVEGAIEGGAGGFAAGLIFGPETVGASIPVFTLGSAAGGALGGE